MILFDFDDWKIPALQVKEPPEPLGTIGAGYNL